MEEFVWNPWHGCKKFSEGCANCYVYRRDESIGKDASFVEKTKAFDMPLKRRRAGEYKISAGSHVFVCMTSDFFLDEADLWRNDIWYMMRARRDVNFTIITKRIYRLEKCLPDDWRGGYENVEIGVTMENQRQCDKRISAFKDAPVKSKFIICEPLLTAIDMRRYLGKWVSRVIAGGESGPNARQCRYEWILDLRSQCVSAGVGFRFKQTGANFIKDDRAYLIARDKQMSQARKAGIDYRAYESGN
ncbi:MAG: DUF5131 family protein [Clostridia bacterium]|nr:DUF5131 family protein [Clostridia bacterium]